MQKRQALAGRKAKVFKHLARCVRQARVLARTGHRPTVWGPAGQGLAPSTLRKLRAQVAGISTCRYQGPCATTAIRLGFTGRADPFVALRGELPQNWVQLWHSSELQEERRAVERAWEKLRANLMAAKSRWGRARGPISAVICTLMDLGWSPVAPSRWVDPDGESFDLDAFDVDQLLDFELRGSLDQAVWESAEAHHHGGGLRKGADLTVPRRFLQGLRRQSRHSEAAMAQMVLTGSLWPASRRHGGQEGRPLGGQQASQAQADAGEAQEALRNQEFQRPEPGPRRRRSWTRGVRRLGGRSHQLQCMRWRGPAPGKQPPLPSMRS